MFIGNTCRSIILITIYRGTHATLSKETCLHCLRNLFVMLTLLLGKFENFDISISN